MHLADGLFPQPLGSLQHPRSSGWIKEAISKKRVKREDRREEGTERVEWGGKEKEEGKASFVHPRF